MTDRPAHDHCVQPQPTHDTDKISSLLTRLASENGVRNRVEYIHDQHLPALLDHARGVVVINSTVGLSALRHGAPTKVCGEAIYDMPGLTF